MTHLLQISICIFIITALPNLITTQPLTNCSPDNPCKGSLLCLDNTCKCGNDTKYDIEAKICKKLVGYPCNVNTDCVDGAACTPTGACHCPAGSVLSKERACLLTHGQPCGSKRGHGAPDLPCADFRNLFCDNEGPKCECVEGFTFEYLGDTCVGKPGSECAKKVEHLLSDTNTIETKVTPGLCKNGISCLEKTNTCEVPNRARNSNQFPVSESLAIQLTILILAYPYPALTC